MPFRTFRAFPFLPVAFAGILLAACTQPLPEAPKPTGKSNAAMVAEIQAAGERDKSVINVHPLVDPGITTLQDGARTDERNGQFDAAAAKLDMALKRSPNSPAVLQDRAELAIYMGHYDMAEQLAHQSWSLGSKQGPLCARNWQTIVEMRQRVNDTASAATASKSVEACREPGIQRF
ncbi:tetratricopeptide repeat protein [Dyella sp. M7H15-1]|uniref:tetratricopeptide repeat protein n=1 Tax=Dyella sp. M7H15-1 TaxID=2501295 RepID=UPI001F0BBB64|nr:tetratricopeptide repeat protein [Dyella sp. M7H15-1]